MWRVLLLTFMVNLLVPSVLSAHTGSAAGPPVAVQAFEGDTIQADTVQVGETMQEIRLADGSVVIGRVTEVTAEDITVETAGGIRMELQRSQIRSLRPARGQVVDGRFWRTDPNRTRLFFAPTGRPLDRGEGYLASYMLFFPFVGYGVTDHFTMAGGTPILPGIIGETFYLAPKLTLVSRPGVDLAAGTIAFFATEEIDEGSVGVVYGTGTFGDVERSLTAAVGWGFALGGDNSSLSNDPVFMVGGEFRMGESTKLLTENWLAPGDGGADGILTGGVRFFGERLSADLGIGLGMADGGVECCLPLVNFVYVWGER